MEQKTKIRAEDGRQEMLITRDFELPVELLFRAYAEAELIEQWMMGTKVLKLESKKHGSYLTETRDHKGNVAFRANGVIHEFIPNRKIIRTFEMSNMPFGVQMEIYEFEKLDSDHSRLNMHVIYESVEQRDQVLKLPFAKGLGMAHDRIEDSLSKLK